MIGLTKIAYEALRLENSDRLPRSPKEWWKKSKLATIWVFICLVVEVPLLALKYIIMGVCFIPHKIYEALEE